jgi:trk system potassium uptake protein TrkA
MRVIIVGAGEVGYQIAKFLVLEDVDVVVIDRDKENLKRISAEMDVAVVEAEGGDPSALKEGGADEADILLAVTNSDEANMIACLLARVMFKIPRKIARIRTPDYFFNQGLLSEENLDINPAINPELEVARAITRLLEIPFATDVEDFEEGIIKIIGFKVGKKNRLTGNTLMSLRESMNQNFIIGVIQREGKTIIPSGNDTIKENDIIYLPIKKWELSDTAKMLEVSTKPAKRIMLLGGGKIGYYIASTMEHMADIKIIEKDLDRCKYLSKYLGRSLVLQGDGADQKLLLEENIGDMDVFVAVSNNEELNIMASLLAKKLGARKAIAIVSRTDYIPIAHSLGLEAVLSPRIITASTILRYVREGDILSLTTIAEGNAEVIEARVGKSSRLVGKPLKDTNLPAASLIGTIIRGEDVIIPTGTDVIRNDDKLIIFALRESIKEVEKILK